MEEPEIKSPIFYTIPNAQEAFDNTSKSLDEIEIEQFMPEIAERIKLALERKSYATLLGPFSFEAAEKISLLLQEKYAYSSATTNAGMGTDGKPLSYVSVNWKYLPANTRERLN